MTDKKTLTDAEAQAMLDQLTRHFGEPVKPVSKYCASFRAWSKVHLDKADETRKKLFPGLNKAPNDPAWKVAFDEYHRILNLHDYLGGRRALGDLTDLDYQLENLRQEENTASMLGSLERRISKSSLLSRLIYGDEMLRTEKCPIHEGRWSGCEFGMGDQCPYMCQLTGWVMHPDDVAKWRAKEDPKFGETCETCHKPYVEDELTSCSNFFHACRECFWWQGAVYYPCAGHRDEWITRRDEERVAKRKAAAAKAAKESK